MHARLVLLIILLAAGGCAAPGSQVGARPGLRPAVVPGRPAGAAPGAAAAQAQPPAPPEPPNPFDQEPSSFLVPAGHFPAGETAIVKVCVTPGGQIASADVVSSSGDKRFDDLAVVWARQVRLRSLPEGAQTDALCGAVRVEIRPAPVPEALPGRQSALS